MSWTCHQTSNIMMKLPYKVREKWRSHACDLQERRGCRVLFIDLVNFVEKQVRIASDPLFGNIQDSKCTSCNKPPTVSEPRHRKQGTFATGVTAMKETKATWIIRSSPFLPKVTTNAVYSANKPATHLLTV